MNALLSSTKLWLSTTWLFRSYMPVLRKRSFKLNKGKNNLKATRFILISLRMLLRTKPLERAKTSNGSEVDLLILKMKTKSWNREKKKLIVRAKQQENKKDKFLPRWQLNFTKNRNRCKSYNLKLKKSRRKIKHLNKILKTRSIKRIKMLWKSDKLSTLSTIFIKFATRSQRKKERESQHSISNLNTTPNWCSI